MKRLFFCCLFIAATINSGAQADNKIVLGTIDSVHSTILNEQRKIWVYVPGNGGIDIYSKQRYPVVYLLDGDAHFFSVVGMIQQLSSVNGNTICPEMIVVGIPNTDRTRDLTPTHVVSDPPYVDSAFVVNSGGGEKFTAFIEKELMPHIDSVYPTEPYRMLIGHSFGGLTVMNTIVHHTNLFNAYVAIDPSMWWDKLKLLNETKMAAANKKFMGTSLFLGIANTMEPGMNITNVKKDTAGSSRHIRSILELSNTLKSSKQSELNYQDKYYGDDDHGSVPLISTYDALHFIFNFYPLKLTFKDYHDTGLAVAKKIEDHYKLVSEKFGYKVLPPESMINGMGYQALGSKQFTKAAYLFKLNVANYPESYNVYDSLGDYYDGVADKANAIENYKKALQLKENPESRKKLEKLQTK
jgi:uncharacterized protein